MPLCLSATARKSLIYVTPMDAHKSDFSVPDRKYRANLIQKMNIVSLS